MPESSPAPKPITLTCMPGTLRDLIIAARRTLPNLGGAELVGAAQSINAIEAAFQSALAAQQAAEAAAKESDHG